MFATHRHKLPLTFGRPSWTLLLCSKGLKSFTVFSTHGPCEPLRPVTTLLHFSLSAVSHTTSGNERPHQSTISSTKADHQEGLLGGVPLCQSPSIMTSMIVFITHTFTVQWQWTISIKARFQRTMYIMHFLFVKLMRWTADWCVVPVGILAEISCWRVLSQLATVSRNFLHSARRRRRQYCANYAKSFSSPPTETSLALSWVVQLDKGLPYSTANMIYRPRAARWPTAPELSVRDGWWCGWTCRPRLRGVHWRPSDSSFIHLESKTASRGRVAVARLPDTTWGHTSLDVSVHDFTVAACERNIDQTNNCHNCVRIFPDVTQRVNDLIMITLLVLLRTQLLTL